MFMRTTVFEIAGGGQQGVGIKRVSTGRVNPITGGRAFCPGPSDY